MFSWLMTIKAVLISSGVASMGLFLKVSIPVAVDYTPILWSLLLSWLKPPYVYILTNGIIITIVASSKYYTSHHHNHPEKDDIVYSGHGYNHIHNEHIIGHASPRMLEATLLMEELTELEPEKIKEMVTMVEDGDEMEEEVKSVIKEESLPPTEKPLISSRLSHRKLVKASPEGGKALRVAKPKRNETLDNTWKMITEGKSTPLTRQLYRRFDTFSRGDSGGSEVKPVYKKSETFKDRTNNYQVLEKKGKMRREPTLSQEELNRRVEAFIKKFNEEMKLQRMESLRQYKEITSRGL